MFRREKSERLLQEAGLARREFLKGITLMGMLALLTALAPACFRKAGRIPEPPTPTSPTLSTPSSEQNTEQVSKPAPPDEKDKAKAVSEPAIKTKEGNMATKISLVRTTNRAEGVRKAVALFKSNPVRDKAVVLKPNFNSADVSPGSTHIDTLRALVQTLKEMGAGQITLAERSGPGLPTREVMEKKGIFELAKELGFEIVNLEELEPDGWVHIRPKDSHWQDGFLFPKIYTEAECIVETCCLKTHSFGGHFTMSLKLAVGTVPRVGYNFMRELHSSPYQRQLIAEINTAFSPHLVVLDGVDAFTTGGPATGTRVQAGIMLAGSDRVAIDAVGVAVLRSLGTTPEVSRGKIFEQDQIARAAELGLGVKSADQIQLITGDTESEAYCGKIREILLQG